MKTLKLHDGKKTDKENVPAAWNEFFDSPLLAPFSDMGRLWDRWSRATGYPALSRIKAPVVDVSEDDKEVTVKAEIPGMNAKELELTFANGILRLKGEKKGESEEKRKNTWHKESWQGSFVRSIPLGEGVDFAKAQAGHKDGILTVVLPKKPGATQNPVKIEIQ